ncbi:protease, partial [Klebsiella pneumoniae]
MNKSTIALIMAMLSGTAYADSTQLTPNFSPESVTV